MGPLHFCHRRNFLTSSLQAFWRTCYILFFFDVSFLSQMWSLFTQCTAFIHLVLISATTEVVGCNCCVQRSLFCMRITKDPGIQFIGGMQCFISILIENLAPLPYIENSYRIWLGLLLHMETLKLRVRRAHSEEWDLNQGLRFRENFKQFVTGGQFT